MPKINLKDSMMNVVQKIAEGNPGAIVVCMELINKTPIIDPQNGFGGIGNILTLDDKKIYADRIWMFYKDVCNENILYMIALMRGNQLGIISEKQLNYAIDNRGKGINIIDILEKVEKKLIEFNK